MCLASVGMGWPPAYSHAPSQPAWAGSLGEAENPTYEPRVDRELVGDTLKLIHSLDRHEASFAMSSDRMRFTPASPSSPIPLHGALHVDRAAGVPTTSPQAELAGIERPSTPRRSRSRAADEHAR